ncbi:hypothetical protein OHB26_14340 [Nocardia sp. NBC_01503]|uniref:hypothetical protein n=1 Tax=Nocardia sp. NBC_01503 TaxID=2975997 RepID=UPI002E7B92D9|nr:hypothetical protein [Nocardia sp. NBC_01503]WTL35264.1 hypothetical protein OHB26_14340 [Nocardia sp. NBC_01503]
MGNLFKSVPVAIALAAAGVALNTPQASAEIGTSVIIAGGGLSNGFGTGCTYNVVANSTSWSGMNFFDNGVQFAATPDVSAPTTRTASWTPRTTGTHTLVVTQGEDSKTIVLTVGTGINGGSSCFVI